MTWETASPDGEYEEMTDAEMESIFSNVMKEKRVSLESVLKKREISWKDFKLEFESKMPNKSSGKLSLILIFHDTPWGEENPNEAYIRNELTNLFQKISPPDNTLLIFPELSQEHPRWDERPELGKLLQELLAALRFTAAIDPESIHFIGIGGGAAGAAFWAGQVAPSIASVHVLVPKGMMPLYNLAQVKTVLYHDRACVAEEEGNNAEKYAITLKKMRSIVKSAYKYAYRDYTSEGPRDIPEETSKYSRKIDLANYAISNCLKLKRLSTFNSIVWYQPEGSKITSYGILSIREKQIGRSFILYFGHIGENKISISCTRQLNIFIRFNRGMFDLNKEIKVYLGNELKVNQKIQLPSKFVTETAEEQGDLRQMYVGCLAVSIPEPTYSSKKISE